MAVTDFTGADTPDQKGRTVLVTGANAGIGFEIARTMASRGARVLLGCRNADKAAAAMASLTTIIPGADVAVVPLDLGDLASIEQAAAQVRAEPRLDALINNAGLMMPPRQLTADGFESQFGVNHLGTFALTGHLLDTLEKTEGSRVIVTASVAHKSGVIDFDDPNAEHSYSKWPRYAMSKLANVLHVTELARRLDAAGASTIAVGCHPGVADTELFRFMPAPMKLFGPFTRHVFNSAERGAWAALAGATSPQAANGAYLGPQRLMEWAGPVGTAALSKNARDRASADRLWRLSEELTGVRYLSQ